MGSNIENRLRRKAEVERVAAQARETRKKRIVVAGVIVVVALLVIGGAFWITSSSDETKGQAIAPAPSSLDAGVVETRDGVVVTSASLVPRRVSIATQTSSARSAGSCRRPSAHRSSTRSTPVNSPCATTWSRCSTPGRTRSATRSIPRTPRSPPPTR